LISIGLVYFILAFLNEIFFQHINNLNSNFIIFESFIVVSMSLYALYRILINDEIQAVVRYPHFWVWTSLLFYFSCSFFFWPCIKILYKQKSHYYGFIVSLQVIMNMVAYAGIGLTFIFFPKLTNDES